MNKLIPRKRAPDERDADACLTEVQALLKSVTAVGKAPALEESGGANALTSRLHAEQVYMERKKQYNHEIREAETALAEVKKLLKSQLDERLRLLEKKADLAERLTEIRKKQVHILETSTQAVVQVPQK
tara:strand:- start:262 stop:648 length:387 start_codon:yes stop_codon:yes gene_type:complete